MQAMIKIKKITFFAVLIALVSVGCGKKQEQASKADSTAASGAKIDSIALGLKVDSAALAPVQNVPYTLKEGKRLFSHYCGVCHGETGDGTGQYYGSTLQPSPANFTDSAFVKTLTDEKMYKAISEGSSSVGKSNMCPPWGKTLHREEIEFIMAYIRTFTKART